MNWLSVAVGWTAALALGEPKKAHPKMRAAAAHQSRRSVPDEQGVVPRPSLEAERTMVTPMAFAAWAALLQPTAFPDWDVTAPPAPPGA
jgi:hypothetical protein